MGLFGLVTMHTEEAKDIPHPLNALHSISWAPDATIAGCALNGAVMELACSAFSTTTYSRTQALTCWVTRSSASSGFDTTFCLSSCNLAISCNVWSSRVFCDCINADSASKLECDGFRTGVAHVLNWGESIRFGAFFFHRVTDNDMDV